MRSGSTRWRAPCELAARPRSRCATVPAPSIFAPILLRQSARSTISGSRAAFSITVVPLASDGRHQRGVGAADRHLGKIDLAAAQAVVGACAIDVAAVDLDLRAEPLQRHDEEIDRPRADGAAARQRDLRLAHAREQRRDHPEARPHLRDELIGRGGVDDVGGARCAASGRRIGVSPGRLPPDHDVDAVIAEDALQQRRRRRAAARCRGSASRRSAGSRSSAAASRSWRRRSGSCHSAAGRRRCECDPCPRSSPFRQRRRSRAKPSAPATGAAPHGRHYGAGC